MNLYKLEKSDLPMLCAGIISEEYAEYNVRVPETMTLDAGREYIIFGKIDTDLPNTWTMMASQPNEEIDESIIVLADPDAAKYVNGIADHWYNDAGNGPVLLDTAHNNYSNRCIHYTEDLNHWATGWTDWNMCLDMRGGPNWVSNFRAAPINLDATVDEFYKNPFIMHWNIHNLNISWLQNRIN